MKANALLSVMVVILVACAGPVETGVETRPDVSSNAATEQGESIGDTSTISPLGNEPPGPLDAQRDQVPASSQDTAPSTSAGDSGPLPDQEHGGLQPIIDAAKTDLAQRLGIEVNEVLVRSAEEVTWSDSSLGCPQPGKVYAQVLTEGAVIRLGFDGVDYSYHAGEGRQPFLCEDSSTLVSPSAAHQSVIDQARHDLAQRAVVTPEDIVLISVQPIDVIASTPCAPGVLDVVDPEEGRVPAVEVILQGGVEAHRYVSVALVLHYCGVGVALGKW